MSKIDIRSLKFHELQQIVKDLGLPAFRAGQIFKWLQLGVESFDEMADIPIKVTRRLLYCNRKNQKKT